MGLMMSKALSRLFGKKEMRILMVRSDAGWGQQRFSITNSPVQGAAAAGRSPPTTRSTTVLDTGITMSLPPGELRSLFLSFAYYRPTRAAFACLHTGWSGRSW